MSIFKRKNKAKKAAEQESKQAADDKPAPAPYKHVPKHAAADAAIRPTEKGEQAKLAAANQHRLSIAARDYAMGTAADRQSIAHTAMHSTPSPSSFAGLQRQTRGPYGIQKNHSAEVFVTDPDAPPMPTPPTQIGSTISRTGTPSLQVGNSISRSGTPGSTGGYFSQPLNQSPSFDSPILGNPKMQMAARDRGYINPHNSADSGYGSVSHSRAPSEHFNLAEINGAHLPRNNSGFLPELSLSEELAREPAFSEHSFGGDEAQEVPPKKAPEGVLKSGKGYLERQASLLDMRQDSRATKSAKGPKQTRFEQAPEAVEQETQEQPARTLSHSRSPQQMFLGQPERNARPESATIPQPQYTLPIRSSTPPPAIHEEPSSSYAIPVRQTEPQPQVFSEPQTQYTMPARISTPPPAREREELSSPIRYASPPPQSNYAPLERIVSGGHQSIMSALPVSKLEGFKVNKRGKILDEEGEAIGELCEGDIMDCVRQRVNAYGEVQDDYGSIVGRVRPIGRMLDSPIMRMSSPVPFHQQQQQYYQERPMSPAFSVGRRESAAEAFTPAWQQQHLHNPQPVLAQELQHYLATMPQDSSRSAVGPIEFPNNVTAVELPAIEAEQQPEEEVLPIFDHSDVFLPAPTVPARSPRRNETPSPPIEKQEPQLQRPMSMQPIQQTDWASQEVPRSQSKHISAPVPARQPESQPEVHEWAAASAIERLQEEPEQTAELPPHMAQQRRQALMRNSSNSSMTDLAKSYSRPSMSSVPEDSQLADDDRSPALFSYKGDIPATEGPAPNALLAPPRAHGAKSPALPSLPRQNSTNLHSINSMQFSAGGLPGSRGLAPGRQFSTGVPGPRPILNTRNSSSAPLKRSPLSSHETSPPDSDEGSFDDSKIGLARGMHSRQPSTHTVASMQSSAGKPRMYFTHGGKVTLDSEQSPAQAAAKAAAVNTQAERPQSSAAPSISDVSSMKKKGRFSLSFGKKGVAA
ncbi:hypothetical protein LTR85_004997 [Meristemomyces frigidus]|nr:hypothetical protein LTR85_004997 [Meristemomyces frigidus]